MSAKGERVRYPDSVDPVATDGRDISASVATLQGEAAQQRVRGADRHLEEIAPQPWGRVPEITARDTTYYDRPMLKKPVWSVDIPIYYFLGGTAGAALTLGAAFQLVARGKSRDLRELAAACHWIGIIGSTAGAAFLIHDLGRPARFLAMMRVFRPTSPMNIGVWILGSAAPTAIATGLFLNRKGALGKVGEVCGYASGVFGAGLAGYTGVLVSNTAIPAWQESQAWLPVLFFASSASAAASVIDIAVTHEAAQRMTAVLGTAGRIAEIAAALKVEHAASSTPKVSEPFKKGGTATLWKAATALTAASLAVSLLPGRSRKRARIAGLLGTAGSLCLRFAIHYIGNRSAQEPRASFQSQRSRPQPVP